MDKILAQRTIEEVLAKFDFKPVHEYMQRVDWKYFYGMPSLEDIRSTARQCLEEVIHSKDSTHGSVRTGGFEARLDRWENGELYYLILEFVPFRAESYFHV